MTTFRIDAENNITAMGGSEQIEESGGETETFGNLQELTALAAKWSTAAGRDLEPFARCAASAAIHQPPSGGHADMECPSAPWAQRRRTEGTRGDETVKGCQEGAAGSAKRAWRQ